MVAMEKESALLGYMLLIGVYVRFCHCGVPVYYFSSEAAEKNDVILLEGKETVFQCLQNKTCVIVSIRQQHVRDMEDRLIVNASVLNPKFKEEYVYSYAEVESSAVHNLTILSPDTKFSGSEYSCICHSSYKSLFLKTTVVKPPTCLYNAELKKEVLTGWTSDWFEINCTLEKSDTVVVMNLETQCPHQQNPKTDNATHWFIGMSVKPEKSCSNSSICVSFSFEVRNTSSTSDDDEVSKICILGPWHYFDDLTLERAQENITFVQGDKFNFTCKCNIANGSVKWDVTDNSSSGNLVYEKEERGKSVYFTILNVKDKSRPYLVTASCTASFEGKEASWTFYAFFLPAEFESSLWSHWVGVAFGVYVFTAIAILSTMFLCVECRRN